MKFFRSIFKKLIKKGIKITIVTRDPKEHEGKYKYQAEHGINKINEN